MKDEMVRKGRTEDTIQVIEEQVSVGSAQKPRERVVVRIVPVEQEKRVDVTLGREHVEIERVEVNRPIDEVPSIREEHDVVIIPIVEEVLAVEKRLVLREELHIKKWIEERTEERTVIVRSEEAHVHREDPGSPAHREPNDGGDDS
jgi:stress response protein YsnF